jgi:hypothetical protein
MAAARPILTDLFMNPPKAVEDLQSPSLSRGKERHLAFSMDAIGQAKSREDLSIHILYRYLARNDAQS